MNKFITLDEPLFRYVEDHRTHAGDPLVARLRDETARLGDDAKMQISPDQGSFLTVLVAALGVREAIEVGTFTGYSSLCIARGLPEQGRLLCLDESEPWTSIARRYWREAAVDCKIELRVGQAISLLEKIEKESFFDFAFVDADKIEYDRYFELLLPRIRSNGVLLFDNMLRHGSVVDPDSSDETARAIDALNKKLARDSRVDAVLLSIADGIQMCRKR